MEASRSCSAAEDLEVSAEAGAFSGDEAEADLGSTLGGSVANFALSAAFCSAASCASTSLTAWGMRQIKTEVMANAANQADALARGLLLFL